MSLAGNLEDLGLGEILQIVSLSRKTGVLSLSSRGRNGSVFFRNGQVVMASSSTYQLSLGEVLIQKGVIDRGVLRKALAFQQQHGFHELLGVILVKNFSVLQDVIEEVVREQIENLVFSFFSWAEGDYKFSVQSDIDIAADTKQDPMQFILAQGLNPQFLAMEGNRILDQRHHSAVSDDPLEDGLNLSFDPAEPALLTSQIPAELQPVVVVDDDGPTLRAISDGLVECGLVVHAMNSSEDTLAKVDTLNRSGACPVVLIDLIMPKMDGSGVLGGIELMELLHNNFKLRHIIVMSDYYHAEAEEKVHQLGYRFLIKPRRVEIGNQENLQNFINQLRADIQQSITPVTTCLQERYNLGDELRIEMGEGADAEPSFFEDLPIQTGGLSLLRGMLEELNNPDLQGGVLLLILRFASEYFDRAIVFTITEGIISGSGQFGISGGGKSGDELVRAINVPLEADSIFKDSLTTGRSIVFKPAPTPVNRTFFEQLGGGFPEEVFVGSIVNQSRVIGFLYGDNFLKRCPLGDVESLSIFLSQAGIAMEKSLLERKLHERATV